MENIDLRLDSSNRCFCLKSLNTILEALSNAYALKIGDFRVRDECRLIRSLSCEMLTVGRVGSVGSVGKVIKAVVVAENKRRFECANLRPDKVVSSASSSDSQLFVRPRHRIHAFKSGRLAN